MSDEELEKKANDYIDECTKKSGFVILADFIRTQFKDLFMAGYRIAEKDLSCVQQRLNMLEEHNMTIDDVITCLENHNEIHSRQEPRAYYITKALNIAIDFLKNHRWHYLSRGELPGKIRVICFTKYVDIWIGERIEKNTERYKWKLFTDKFEEYYGDDEIIAWQYLPELPKERI